MIGTIMLANRFGLARGFTDADRALFETLAANASAALQYDRLEQAVSELRDLQDQLQHQAHHDPLTGLANRSLFSQQVREALEPGDAGRGRRDVHRPRRLQGRQRHARARRSATSCCAASPSRLVRSVRQRRRRRAPRRRRVRRARPPRRRTSSAAPSSSPSARCSRSCCRSPPARSRSTSASAIGIAASQHARTHAEELLRDADVAMYDAKEGGKRRFAVFTPAMRDSIVRRHGLKAELERAIEERELDRPVPADRRPRDRRDRLGRGARALEPSGPRPHPPARVHPARGGHRA